MCGPKASIEPAFLAVVSAVALVGGVIMLAVGLPCVIIADPGGLPTTGLMPISTWLLVNGAFTLGLALVLFIVSVVTWRMHVDKSTLNVPYAWGLVIIPVFLFEFVWWVLGIVVVAQYGDHKDASEWATVLAMICIKGVTYVGGKMCGSSSE